MIRIVTVKWRKSHSKSKASLIFSKQKVCSRKQKVSNKPHSVAGSSGPKSIKHLSIAQCLFSCKDQGPLIFQN